MLIYAMFLLSFDAIGWVTGGGRTSSLYEVMPKLLLLDTGETRYTVIAEKCSV